MATPTVGRSIARAPFSPSPTCKRPLVALIALLAPGLSQADSGITDLGALNGGSEFFVGPDSLGTSAAFGVNADGSVIIGAASDGAAGNAWSAFRWTETTGMQSLGLLNGGAYSDGQGVSDDGNVIVGGYDDAITGTEGAFRWTTASGMQSLGGLNGGDYAWAQGVSGDGTVVVGEAEDGPGGAIRPIRWTAAGGMQSLGALNGGSSGDARAANSDGSVIVGAARDGAIGHAQRAFRWTQATGIQSLGVINSGTSSRAYAVSSDGSVVAGVSTDGAAGDANRAFRWTQASGMQSLGVIDGGSFSIAYSMSDDGSIIVGQAADGGAGDVDRAFRWTATTGIQTVEDWLRDNGMTISQDMTKDALGISGDGEVIVGQLTNGQAFLARVSDTGSGLVTVADLQDSLTAVQSGGDMVLSAVSTVLAGAHSRPLARRVDEHRSTYWIAGDWGRDDHGSGSGSLGIAEFGLGHNYGSAQVNMSLGKTWSKQSLAQDGNAETDGTYLLVETLVPVDETLWATLGAYGHRGDAKLRRGYLNVGAQDYSLGDTDVTTWGARARLDWVDAWRPADTSITPYFDLSYNRAKIDAFTETGGGFPARYEKRTEHVTEARLGIDTATAVSSATQFLATLEGVHRFEDSGTRTVGQVIGLSTFALDGREFDQNWLRAGLGIESQLRNSKASLMLNATTEGEAPSYWLAANWQRAF